MIKIAEEATRSDKTSWQARCYGMMHVIYPHIAKPFPDESEMDESHWALRKMQELLARAKKAETLLKKLKEEKS